MRWTLLALLAVATTSAATVTLDANGAQDVQNLQQIALGLINYESTYNRFPAQYYGPSGSPLLSWRVTILPYLGFNSLYNQFDLTKPWNDPVNSGLLSQIPAIFRDPLAAAGSTNTRYLAGFDPNSIFSGTPGVPIASITDGTSNTILVGESTTTSIPWTKPEDITVGACPTLGGSGFSSIVSGSVPFAFADGSVRFISNSAPCGGLRNLFTISDGTSNTIELMEYVISTAVPEPSTLILGVLGFAVLGALRGRRFQYY